MTVHRLALHTKPLNNARLPTPGKRAYRSVDNISLQFSVLAITDSVFVLIIIINYCGAEIAGETPGRYAGEPALP
jgi:hypothetical protein